jgi:pimeloyl-ACP methyl ester carboxylesterase
MAQRPSSTHTVDTPSGSLEVHCWDSVAAGSGSLEENLTVIAVHPWAPLGGGEHNVVGYARRLSAANLRVLTFDMRSSSMVWGVITAHRSEVSQVRAVCSWAQVTFGGRTLLLGSSAGAPVAGSALDGTDAVGLVAIGYTFGMLAAFGFRSHFGAVLRSVKPKLFIMGARDEFTSPAQLHTKVGKAQGRNKLHIFEGVGHFELEQQGYDDQICERIVAWVGTLDTQEASERNANANRNA